MSKLTRAAAVLALVLYAVASMHCHLESVPGFAFLQSCCPADGDTAPEQNCESSECLVEGGSYRLEENTASAPKPLLALALFSTLFEVPIAEPEPVSFLVSEPPEFPKAWQFWHRTALSPRAPSIAS